MTNMGSNEHATTTAFLILAVGTQLVTLTRDPAAWSEPVFWLVYLTIATITIYTCLRWPLASVGKALPAILALAVILHLIVPGRQPSGFTWDWTSAHEMQITELALKRGALVFGSGNIEASQFSYYPGVQMIIMALASITELPLEVIFKLLAPLLNPLILLSLYVFAKRAFKPSRSTAVMIATLLVYAACPRFHFKDAFTVYESVAIVLVPLILGTWGSGAKKTFLSALMLVALVMSHSLTSYVFLAFTLTLALSQLISSRQIALIPSAGKLAIVSFVLVGAWNLHAVTARLQMTLLFTQNFSQAVLVALLGGEETGRVAQVLGARQIDLALTVLGIASLSLLAIAGMIVSLQEKRRHLVVFALCAGAIMFVLYELAPWTSPLIANSSDLQTRGIVFGYLGVAPVAGLGIARILRHARNLRTTLLATALLLLIFFPTIFVGFPHFYYRIDPMDKVGPQTMPQQRFLSAAWLHDHGSNLLHPIYSDELGTYYSGYFGMDQCEEVTVAITSRSYGGCDVIALDLAGASVGGTLVNADISWLEQGSNRVYSTSALTIFTPSSG